MKYYNFKIGDMIVDIKATGLITDIWDDFEKLKLIRIKWIRKSNGSEYNWDYGIEYLTTKIDQRNMEYYPIKE